MLCSDTFNENNPPTSDPTYISSLGSAVYKAMSKANKDAVWLMQVYPPHGPLNLLLSLYFLFYNLTFSAFLVGFAGHFCYNDLQMVPSNISHLNI